MKRHLYNMAKAVQTVSPVATTATTVTGAAVDRSNGARGEFRSALLIVNAGVVTSGTYTVELQESDASGSGFAAVADADLIGTEPVISTSNDVQAHEVGYRGAKRYLRAVLTGASTPSAVLGAVIQLGDGSEPVTRQ